MDDQDTIRTYVLVFNCVTCGTLLTMDNTYEMGIECPNCGAHYEHNATGEIYRYYRGRPSTQWKSNGWAPPVEKK